MSLNESLDKRTLTAAAGPRRARADEFEDLVIVPIFAVVVALVLGALTMLATGVDHRTIGRSYVALLRRLRRLAQRDLRDADGRHPAGACRAGPGARLPRGPVQHRRGGPARDGRACGGDLRVHLLRASLRDPDAVVASGRGARRARFYASIAGYLRAATGAHEVISTIMLNLISYRLLDYMLRLDWVQREGRADPCRGRCRRMRELPRLLDWIDPNLRVHAGVFLMLLAVGSSTGCCSAPRLGFEFRASARTPMRRAMPACGRR
jgi:hypothetical protein